MSHADDQYTHPAKIGGIGETVASFSGDGSVSVRQVQAKETSSIWKGAKRVLALGDEAIKEYPPRQSGYIDYRIENTSVSWRGGDSYLCGMPGHLQRCPHISRVKRFREEHQR